MTAPLRTLLLAALLSPTFGCLGFVEEPYTDNWMVKWKFRDQKVDLGGQKVRDGRFSVTGKSEFSAAFAWVPIELGDGGRVHGDFRFERPEEIGGDALTGIQLQPLGPEAPIFFLVQSLLVGADLTLNVFGQVGSDLVFQKVLTGQEQVSLELRADATDFHFFVDGVKEGEAPNPDPTLDWVPGFGFSGLHVGERISLESAKVVAGAGKAGHSPKQQVKRSIFQASEPIQDVLRANDGMAQAPQDTIAGLTLAKAAILAAIDEANTKLTDEDLRDDVEDDLLDALGKVNKLVKKLQKKADQGKSLKQKKIRKSVAKILRKTIRAGVRLATPPFP